MHTRQRVPSRHLWRTLGAALGACTVLGTALPVGAAPLSPFVAANAGVFDGPGNDVIPEVLNTSATGPVVTDTGSLPSAFGRFRAAFGANGFDIRVTGGLDREVDGGSGWSDGFTVSGGSGGGLLDVSTRIRGTAQGDVDMGYALYASAQPFDLQVLVDTIGANRSGFAALQFPNATRVLLTGIANRCGLPGASRDCGSLPFTNFEGSMDLSLTAQVPFTYDQPLYLVSLFSGGVGVFGGSASFLNSADFGISAPAGSTLQTLSNTLYVNAVPEPRPALLLAAGLAALAAWRGWRRGGASTAP